MPFDFEKETLRASGLESSDQIFYYLGKLDKLYRKFLTRARRGVCDPVAEARELFDWLWEEKPFRYDAYSNFKLNEVIDAQMSGDIPRVGNCLGLTLLYNCLLREMGINAGAVWLEYAFGIGPHVLTVLHTKARMFDIENILPEGFDYEGHLDDHSRRLWGDKELVADLHHSLCNESSEKGRFDVALRHYDSALRLNPQYERAHLNKAILLERMKRDQQGNQR